MEKIEINLNKQYNNFLLFLSNLAMEEETKELIKKINEKKEENKQIKEKNESIQKKIIELQKKIFLESKKIAKNK